MKLLCQKLAIDKMTIKQFSINLVICLLQWRLGETMRASVVLLFALMALAFVAAYAADQVSIHDNILFFSPNKVCSVLE